MNVMRVFPSNAVHKPMLARRDVVGEIINLLARSVEAEEVQHDNYILLHVTDEEEDCIDRYFAEKAE